MNCAPLLPAILSDYALSIVHHEHLRTSENVVVKLLSDRGQSYALRIRKVMGSYQEHLLSELTVLRDFSAQAQALVPAPLATRSGQPFCRVTNEGEEYLCILFSWVPGVHVDAGHLTESHMVSMAQAVAHLHHFSSTYHPPEGFVRPVYDADWFFGKQSWSTSEAFAARLQPDEAAGLRTLNETVRTRLQQYPRNMDSFGLIHYDLHVGNFLFQENSANMIDFDECGFGYYLFDVAHLLFEFIEDPRFGAFKEKWWPHTMRKHGPSRDFQMRTSTCFWPFRASPMPTGSIAFFGGMEMTAPSAIGSQKFCNGPEPSWDNRVLAGQKPLPAKKFLIA